MRPRCIIYRKYVLGGTAWDAMGVRHSYSCVTTVTTKRINKNRVEEESILKNKKYVDVGSQQRTTQKYDMSSMAKIFSCCTFSTLEDANRCRINRPLTDSERQEKDSNIELSERTI